MPENMHDFGVWAPFRNKIPIFYGPSITHYGDHFATKKSIKIG